MTRYEKEIKEMTLDRYSELRMGDSGCDGHCDIYDFCDKYIELPATKTKCKEIWKKWLKQEVKNNG